MISVYPSTEQRFVDNGIKILKPNKALIRKEHNGDYYITLKDSIENLEYYQNGLIVRVPTPWGYQGFRLKNPKIENNKITVIGKHLYFDTQRYVIADSYVVEKNCNDALDHLNNACDSPTPFIFISDIKTEESYRCVRKSLEKAISDVLDRWGGNLYRDNYKIEIRANLGQDRGVTLSYLKNIKNISSDENWDNVVTKILPHGKDGLTLPEIFVELDEKLYDIPYTKEIEIDQSDIVEDDYKIDNVLDEEAYKEALISDLRQKASNYLEENKLPQVNYTLSSNLKNVSDVGDTIYVQHPKIKLDLVTNVIALEYDCILDKYTKIEFGNFKNKLKDLVTNVTSKVSEEVKKETNENVGKFQKEFADALDKLNMATGNSYIIRDNGQAFIVDRLPKETARNVIRFNNAGIGFSQNGINGNFNSAWTIDGTLDMQQINVINLIADMIKGGTLKLGSNLGENGKLELYDESNTLIFLADKTGTTYYCKNGEYIKINPEVGFAGFDANDKNIYWVDGYEFHQRKSVVEEEITIAYRLRYIPITTEKNVGIGLVPVNKGR